jgi:hypothetical protein
MADDPKITLEFGGHCPDCAERRVALPLALPAVGDDFYWLVRDFDSFRRFMLEELAARFPERRIWTPADMEVVLIEVLADLMDQLSDMLDRVDSEAYLETARRPESVRRLLAFIGYDAATEAGFQDDPAGIENPRTKEQHLELDWRKNPANMEEARREGPMAIHTQRRMVTVDDYARRLVDHPLVLRGTAWEEWSGSWTTVHVALVLWQDHELDEAGLMFPDNLKHEVAVFHQRHNLKEIVWLPEPPALRTILFSYLDVFRLLGQEVILHDAVPVGIKMAISIRVADDFFQSEVRHAVQQALGKGPGGFFEPGRLDFGEDLYASDIFQTLMSLAGVENVCLNRFKRFGNQYADQTANGIIILQGLGIAVCDNDPVHPERGFFSLKLSGGRRG